MIALPVLVKTRRSGVSQVQGIDMTFTTAFCAIVFLVATNLLVGR